MVDVLGELKRTSAEIGAEIDDLRKRIAMLEQQKAAFDVVISTYEPTYAAATSPGVSRRRKVKAATASPPCSRISIVEVHASHAPSGRAANHNSGMRRSVRP
ncbi:hypothetical protein [Rhizobium sp. R693]|uniref:hypothetical protein n=1 Tax=Rhizobium sp. R693 TaxID=1764276 RepID=UPI000B52A0E7|nr:hypothetical protein [Rhizobium sp. R693]OWW00399.1 hypothetical protein ATY79_02595 [Rhizobium sp. R693]